MCADRYSIGVAANDRVGILLGDMTFRRLGTYDDIVCLQLRSNMGDNSEHDDAHPPVCLDDESMEREAVGYDLYENP